MGHYLKSKPGSIEEAVSSVQSLPFIEDKEAYTKFFNSALKKFKVKSPAELKSDEEKKKFFDYIDKNYKSDAEKKTGKEDPKESKTLTGKKMSEVETNKIETKESLVPSMKKALSKVWGEAVEEKMKMEQRRVPDATIKKFADMTDKNQHTEVRLQIAKIVGDKNLIKKYEKLKKDQDKAGSLTGTLQKTRQTLDKELLSKAFDELGNARQVMGAL